VRCSLLESTAPLRLVKSCRTAESTNNLKKIYDGMNSPNDRVLKI